MIQKQVHIYALLQFIPFYKELRENTYTIIKIGIYQQEHLQINIFYLVLRKLFHFSVSLLKQVLTV